MKRTQTPHVWWRRQGRSGNERAYVDLRKWGGSGFYALRAPGARRALTRAEAALAEALAVKVIDEYTTQRALSTTKAALNKPDYWPLDAAVREHLIARAKARRVTAAQVTADEHFLGRFIEHIGKARRLDEIGAPDVRRFIEGSARCPAGPAPRWTMRPCGIT